MNFFQNREFYDYIHDNFDIAPAGTSVMLIEYKQPEYDVFLFSHAGHLHKIKSNKIEHPEGAYILYRRYYEGLSDDEVIKSIEEWYDAKIDFVVGKQAIEDGVEFLVKVPYTGNQLITRGHDS